MPQGASKNRAIATCNCSWGFVESQAMELQGIAIACLMLYAPCTPGFPRRTGPVGPTTPYVTVRCRQGTRDDSNLHMVLRPVPKSVILL